MGTEMNGHVVKRRMAGALTQGKLAEALGVARAPIAAWEQQSTPSPRTTECVLQWLGEEGTGAPVTQLPDKTTDPVGSVAPEGRDG